jgi:hypothetical protein
MDRDITETVWSSVSAVKEMVELAARQHNYSIKQGSYETLIQLSERFRATYRYLKKTVKVLYLSITE